MANEWVETTLDAVADLLSGGTPSKDRADYWGGTIPWATAKDMKRFRLEDTQDHVTENGAENGTKVVPAGTVFLLTRGMTLLNDVPICIAGQPMAFNQDVKALRPKSGVLNEFLPYLLLGQKERLLSSVDLAGHGTGRLNSDQLRRLDVRLPPEPEQRAIAHILGTLDDKIELNRKQNETLEAMTRALFKAWFVDFEPVRAKMEGRWQRGQSLPGLPAHLYDLFPDRLVESELGEIPKGWRVFSFGDVAQQGKGAVNPTDEPGERFTHYSIPAFDAGKMPVIELGGSIKSNKTPVPDGAVLVSKLNPHIPRVWLVGQAGDMAVCSTEFIVWTPKSPANSAFLYCLASSSEFVESMCQLVTGTSNSHQRVKPDQLREIRVFAANENVIAAFSNMVEALMNQVLQNSRQSRTIAQLRDTLLPKLISGELRVPGAEAFLGERGL